LGYNIDAVENIFILHDDKEQATGLCDNNGKDLNWWEGDLFDEFGSIYQLIYEQGCFWFQWIKYPNRRFAIDEVINFADDVKKIGNVHDNPELTENQ
jgi:hypothetical protein